MRLFHINAFNLKNVLKNKNMLNKKDCILIIAVLFAAAVSALSMALYQGTEGQTIRITIDGEIYGEYNLSEDQTITINGVHGYNSVVIESGAAYMDAADCPDKYCVEYKPVSKGNETIICLPHRLVVEVIGGKDAGQPDVIVQ